MRIGQDQALGLTFAGLGIVGGAVAFGYPLGSAGRMGPGFFPLIVSGLLFVVGASLVARSLRGGDLPFVLGELRPILIITASIVAFGYLVGRIGLPLAVLLLTVVSATASREFRFSPWASVGAVALAAACALGFNTLLGLPMPIVGSWFAD